MHSTHSKDSIMQVTHGKMSNIRSYLIYRENFDNENVSNRDTWLTCDRIISNKKVDMW